MIQDSQTNTIYVSSRLKEYGKTYEHIEQAIAETPGLHFRVLEDTNDIWCRDFMPIQISKDKTIGYRYNPDYLMTKSYLKTITKNEQYPCTLRLDLTLDGGNIVKCDDTIVMTEKIFAENRDKSREHILEMLRETFGAEIVILPWNKFVAEEVYGHSDGIVHYMGNGTILLNNYGDWAHQYATNLRKALADKFKVVELSYKNNNSKDNWAYINHVRVGNLVLFPQLNIPEDKEAYEQIAPFYSECKIVQIPSRVIVKKGGALNCVTWNVYQDEKDII